jgi:hypothetical protein
MISEKSIEEVVSDVVRRRKKRNRFNTLAKNLIPEVRFGLINFTVPVVTLANRGLTDECPMSVPGVTRTAKRSEGIDPPSFKSRDRTEVIGSNLLTHSCFQSPLLPSGLSRWLFGVARLGLLDRLR